MAPKQWLETSRLRLLPIATEHMDALHALWCEPHVRKFLWDDIIIPQEATREVIKSSTVSFAEHGYGLWYIASQRDLEMLGFCGLRHHTTSAEVEILYGLWPRVWKRGYANEAVNAVLDFGFNKCQLERISAASAPHNIAALQLLERLGMRYHHERHDYGSYLVYYTLTKAQWQEHATQF